MTTDKVLKTLSTHLIEACLETAYEMDSEM